MPDLWIKEPPATRLIQEETQKEDAGLKKANFGCFLTVPGWVLPMTSTEGFTPPPENVC